MATAQRLPNDVLYLIFLNTLPTAIGDICSLVVREIQPFNLSLVCTSWRAVVLSHPSLWGSIDIVCGSEGPDDPTVAQNVGPILTEWLRRSASTPLDITLNLYPSYNHHVNDNLLDLVLNENRRWNKVKLLLRCDSSRIQRTVVLRCLPSVKSLEFYGNKGYAMELDLSSCTMVCNSQLRLLQAASPTRFLFPEQRGDLRLPNLHELSCDVADMGNTLEDVVAFLSACPNLLSAALYIDRVPQLHPPQQQEPLILPCLRSLTLHSFNRITALGLLSGLSCPSLDTFHYAAEDDPLRSFEPEGDNDAVVTLQHLLTLNAFFSHSRSQSGVYPPLKSLSLLFSLRAVPQESHSRLVPALGELLSFFDGLEELHLSELTINDELMQSMTFRAEKGGGNNTLCRSLKCIDICLVEARGFRKKSLEEMIWSRWATGTGRTTQLQKVTLDIPGFTNFAKESKRMKKCIEEGLKLYTSSLRY